MSEISRGGKGWKQSEGHDFLRLRKGWGHEKWAVKRGRVMQIYARDRAEIHSQKKKEVHYLLKKKKKPGRSRRVELSALSITKNRLDYNLSFHNTDSP